MSRGLTLQISDATYNALQQQAALVGSDPARVAAVSLERQFGRNIDLRTDAEKEAARQRFEQSIGSADIGYPTGIDNEGIDADLAKEYADPHEDR
jgi:hypothetical protein